MRAYAGTAPERTAADWKALADRRDVALQEALRALRLVADRCPHACMGPCPHTPQRDAARGALETIRRIR